ncbi:MAG: replicative DNA helicase [Candidatus Zixiibacteriota bacterium]
MPHGLTLRNRTAKSADVLLSMPHSLDAEQATLGAIMRDFRALPEVLEIIPGAERFYSVKHQRIYSACMSLFQKTEPGDPTTVAEELNRQGVLEQAGGRVYLFELVENVATTANVSYYAEIVAKKAALRSMIDVSTEIVRRCHAQEMEVEELLDHAEQEVFSISESRMKKGFSSLDELLPHTFQQMEKFQETEGGIAGLKVGYDSIDEMTGGLHPGEFVVIAGRPSMGKSALALNIAENIAVENKLGVGLFSLEMSKESLALRMLCGRAHISQHLLRTGRMRDSDWQRLAQAAGPLSGAPIFIDDSGTMTPLEMRAKARRLKSKHKIGLLVIDYMQMMHGTGRPENRQQEMSMISRGMKALAKELEIPVIACSQLSRQVEQRGSDRRPQLSDLRESGAIEQDADVVMFVYREEYYTRHDDPKFPAVEGKAEAIVAKQRNGPTDTVHVAFIREYMRFENLARVT